MVFWKKYFSKISPKQNTISSWPEHLLQTSYTHIKSEKG